MGLFEKLLPANAPPASRSRTPPPLVTVHHAEKALPLVDETGELNIELKGYPKLKVYANDLFHTLINIPNTRFYFVLIGTYFLLFGAFAIIYYSEYVCGDHILDLGLEQAFNNNCIPGVYTYVHAFWFSVQTSMTIGYGGELTPDPDCFLTNLAVALQSVVSLLAAYSLLGVVYARFSRPTRRVSTIVFSQNMVLHEEDGVPRLAFRVANIRKHQIIDTTVRMLVALDNVLTAEHESIFRFTALPVLGGSQKFLGLPCTVAHPITQNSPLHGMSFVMMERCDLEILVLLEGTDASTSAKLQARHSYRPNDIKYNHRFVTMVTRSANGRRSVDFTKFHDTVPVPQESSIPASIPPSLQLGWGSNLSNAKLPPILQSPTALGAPDVYFKSSVWSSDDGGESAGRRRRRTESIPEESTAAESGLGPPMRRDASGGADPDLDSTGRMSRTRSRKSRDRDGSSHRRRSFAGGEAMDRGAGLESADRQNLLLENSSCVTSAFQELEMECAHKEAVAKEKAKQWRQLVIELAARIQQCQATQRGGAEMQHIMELAQEAMERALDYDEE